MAFALNTVTYAWETNPVAQSGSVEYNTPTQRIYIPETGSRTFLSVDVEMYMRDANDGSSISNISTYALSCSVDGNLSGQPAVSRTVAFSADHATLLFKDTFTDLFNARFTGSNHDVSVRWQTPQANAGPWIGHSFRLICTYQYDTAGVGTAIKTVALPLDAYYGTVGTLLTTLAPFGSTAPGYTNIPALDTFLPETNKVYRCYWIEYTGIDACTAAADVNMFTAIDSGSELTRFTLQGNLNTDTYYFDIQSGSFTTSAAHTLRARASLTGRLTTISPTLYVTYEYDATSSKTMNSCIIPFNYDFYAAKNASRPRLYGSADIMIPELNPWLAHSAFINIHPESPAGSRVYTVNNINVLTLTYVRGSSRSSPNKFNVRFDNSARTSANVELKSGYNTIPIALINANQDVYSYSGYILMNYTASALSAPHQHNKTIYFGSGSLSGKAGGGSQYLIPFITSSIHDQITGSYFSNGFMGLNQLNCAAEPSSPFIYLYDYTGSNNASSSLADTNQFEGRGADMGLAETAHRWGRYKHYHNQPDDAYSKRIGYFDPIRYFRIEQNITFPLLWRADYFTMNQNKITVTGSLASCNFPSHNYDIQVFLSGSNVPITPIAITTTTGSGTSKLFYFDWYESNSKIYAVSKGPEYGISNFATTAQSHLLSMSFAPQTSGSAYSYAYVG